MRIRLLVSFKNALFSPTSIYAVFHEALYVLGFGKMDTGAKWSNIEYNGASWEWRPLGVEAPGVGGPWE